MINKLIILITEAIEIYSYMLLIWVIGSWFPQFQTSKFYKIIDSAVSPYARIFRGLIPPIGGFDLSVIVAFIVLGLIQNLLVRLLLSPF